MKKMKLCVSSPECQKFASSEHTVTKIEKPEGMTAPHMYLKCDRCGHESFEAVPRVRCRKKSWPHYNESVGMTFESESHEKKVAKDLKLTAV